MVNLKLQYTVKRHFKLLFTYTKYFERRNVQNVVKSPYRISSTDHSLQELCYLHRKYLSKTIMGKTRWTVEQIIKYLCDEEISTNTTTNY